MNIVELSDKYIGEVLRIYKTEKSEYFRAIGKEMPTDEEILHSLNGKDTGSISFAFVEKSVTYGMVTVNKSTAEIENLCIDYAIADKAARQRMLEFSIKQFSTITLVFIWTDTTEVTLSNLLEDYGFEYTGEQDYVNKERSISKYKYVFRRKK
mgnify:CR=1 FL=1